MYPPPDWPVTPDVEIDQGMSGQIVQAADRIPHLDRELVSPKEQHLFSGRSMASSDEKEARAREAGVGVVDALA